MYTVYGPYVQEGGDDMSAKIAKSMLGFADDFIEGATKGAGATIRNSVTSLKSNMTKNQLKNLKFAGRSESATRLAGKASKMGMQGTPKGMRVGGKFFSGDAPKINRSGAQRVSQQIVQGNNSIGAQVGDAMIGGYRDTIKGMKGKDMSLSNVKNAANAAFRNTDGSMNMKRVAGAAATASIAGRVATGGGLYRDKYGDVNLPGIPLI